MTLLYKNEHISCTNYAEEFNKVFTLMEIPEGHTVERRFLNTTFLVILLQGDIEIRYEIDKSCICVPDIQKKNWLCFSIPFWAKI